MKISAQFLLLNLFFLFSPPSFAMFPLHEAARNGNHSELNQLLNRGASPDAVDRNGQTALYLAAKLGQLNAVRLLIGREADLEIATPWDTGLQNLTPLDIAAREQHTEVVRLLVNAGASTEPRTHCSDIGPESYMELGLRSYDPGNPGPRLDLQRGLLRIRAADDETESAQQALGDLGIK